MNEGRDDGLGRGHFTAKLVRIDDDNNTVGFLDWQGIQKAAEEGAAKIT